MGGKTNFSSPIWKNLAVFGGPAQMLQTGAGGSDAQQLNDPMGLAAPVDDIEPPTIVTTSAKDAQASADVAAENAAQKEADRLRKRRGYASTIVTSASGTSGSPNVLRQTLGGT